MPIVVGAPLRRMDDEQCQAVMYEAMQHVFAVHRDLGRFCDEKVYQAEIACRIPDARRDVTVQATFEGFAKTYGVDLLIGGAVIFELETAAALLERHRGQLLNLLLLAGLAYGKLVNLRPERVEHEFVAAPAGRAQRTGFTVVDAGWQEFPGQCLREKMVALLRDWGTGLDLDLYQDAARHLCGRTDDLASDAVGPLGDSVFRSESMRRATTDAALRITCLAADRLADFETHLRQFLRHVGLRAIQWINITQPSVQFKTIA